MLKLVQQLRRLCAPLVDAPAAEFAFFMTEKTELIGFGDKFLPENVIQLETRAFNLVLDIAPKNRFCSSPVMRKKAQLKFPIKIFCDDLRIVIGFENNRFAVANNRHAVIPFAGQFPNKGTVVIRNIDYFEGNPAIFQNTLLHQAKRTPGNLDQINHFASGSPATWTRVL